LQEFARIKLNSGDFPEAKEYASESQRVAKIAGNLHMEADGLRLEALCLEYLGCYSCCITLLARATHLLDLCGMSGGGTHSAIRTTQAEIYRCKSEYVEALNVQTHILEDYSADQNPYDHGLALINITQIAIEIGSTEDEVQHNINTAGGLFQKINYLPGVIYCDMFRAALNLQLGKLSAAQMLFQKCARSAWGKQTEAVTYCLEKLGAVQEWGPANQVSFPWTVTFLVHSVKCKLRLEIHKALQFLGDVFQGHGDQETAITLFTVALDGFTQMDVHRSRAECMVRLGDLSKLSGDKLKAAALWKIARPLFERSSQGRQLAQLDAKLAGLTDNQSQDNQQETVGHLSELHHHSH
jgi:tetratricopeptide (TPR) repeat protein